jgi:hypothetical protein
MKNKLKDDLIYFAVSKSDSILAKTIRFKMGTTYNHALSIYYCQNIGDFCVTEADVEGVVVRTLDDFLSSGSQIVKCYGYEYINNEFKKYMKSVYDFNGIDYGMLQLVSHAFVFDGSDITKDHDKNKTFICSEYVDVLMGEIGLVTAHDTLKISQDYINPKHNVEHCEMLVKNGVLIKVM